MYHVLNNSTNCPCLLGSSCHFSPDALQHRQAVILLDWAHYLQNKSSHSILTSGDWTGDWILLPSPLQSLSNPLGTSTRLDPVLQTLVSNPVEPPPLVSGSAPSGSHSPRESQVQKPAGALKIKDLSVQVQCAAHGLPQSYH